MNNAIKDFKVSDLQTFSQLTEMLRDDFINNSVSWENKTIDDLFEAMSRYARDIQGYYNNVNQCIDANIPSWQTFADILIGATMYE